MAEIDPKSFEKMEKADSGIQRKVVNGFTYFKGPWLEAWFDDYTEMLRRNQDEKRKQDHRKAGLNEFAQTPEQEKEFNKRKAVQAERKKKAELAAEMAIQNA